ncbi:MAG: GNAT family N-acetyltransferase [Acidimicrobiales bacterium]
MQLTVRLAGPGDLEAIRSIYNHEVTGSTVTFDIVPRTPADQREWLARHQGAYPVVVATGVEEPAVMPVPECTLAPGGTLAVHGPREVAAFGSLSPYRDRPAYSTTVEDSVYVHSAWRGQGVGRMVLDELLRLARAYGYHTVIARAVGDNTASIRLHQSCGFEVVGLERQVGRKFGHWLDVTVMQRMLS